MALDKIIPVGDFRIPDELRGSLSDDGVLHVAEGYTDFVIYGPYWVMQEGLYVVSPQIVPHREAETYGVLELCERGAVLASADLKPGCSLSTKLPDLEGLEIRIKSAGAAFDLLNVIMVYSPDISAAKRAERKALIRKEIEKVDAFLDRSASVSLEEAEAVFGSLGEDYRRLDVVAKALHDGVDARVARALTTGLDFQSALDPWLAAQPRVTVLDAWGEFFVPNSIALSDAGFDIEAVRILSTDRPALSALYAESAGFKDVALQLKDLPHNEYDMTHGMEWFPELKKVQGGFSKLAALTGSAQTICPFTGAILTSSHCLVSPTDAVKQVLLFYRFESVETFYLIISGFSGSKNFLYYPKGNIVLRLHSHLFEWGDMQTIVDQFHRLMMPRLVKVMEYLKAPTHRAIVSGTMQNVGHFFWNEISGLHDYASKGYLDGITVGLTYNADYIDPYTILPDTLLPDRQSLKTEVDLCEAVLDQHLFCIRPIGASISDEMANEIKVLANKKASSEQKVALKQARKADYLIWAALRAHNKVWVNQIDGIVAVAEDLAKAHGRVALYLDGTPDCADAANAIKERLPASVQLFDGTKVSMYDTLMWAFEIDSYIATIGSGLVFVTWLAGKPGVAHSETHHLHQMSFWGHIRENAPKPITPEFSEIKDLGTAGYCDYEIAPEVIQRLFRTLDAKTAI
ncbi:hypothetical protein [Asticcacaulis sp.]|uniref:hypothetical protein n=1 Tax=Asticcacaulis sp. TaxID=1872648 RepID=UPI002616C462|nr:hypothetical protein [Asticcacaulis sp.]